jgi:hypothetical protein
MAQVDRRVVQSGSGLGTKTVIVSLVDGSDNLTESEVAAVVAYFEQERGADGAGDSAFTVVGISGDIAGGTDTVHLALQGTGTFTAGDADLGVAGHTVTEICSFDSENGA